MIKFDATIREVNGVMMVSIPKAYIKHKLLTEGQKYTFMVEGT